MGDDKEDSYPAPNDEAFNALMTLYDFSRRPETMKRQEGNNHHDYNPWGSPHDFHGYDIKAAKTQMGDVKLVSSRFVTKGGRHCLPGDFLTIHYKGFMKEGSKMMKVLDSRKVNGGKPMTFQQGSFHVVKCWELAVVALHAGEQARVACPAYLSNGGAEAYSHMGSKKIPSNTPLTYDIEVLEC